MRPSGSGERKKKTSFQNRGKGKSNLVPQGHSKSVVAQADDDQHGWAFTASSCAVYSPIPGSFPDDVDDDNDKEIPLIGRACKTQNVPGYDSDEDSVMSTLPDLITGPLNQIDEVPSPGPIDATCYPIMRGRSRPCRSSPFAQDRGDKIAVNLQFGVSLSGSALRAHGRPIIVYIDSDGSSDSMPQLVPYSDSDSELDDEYRPMHFRIP